ncbi:hypothetical protein BASA83_013800 [Batrachochytrium salamandrivorans]|nr:hypothetical protein BASA83_013800 [Batrachochytrium salamandrivorans]
MVPPSRYLGSWKVFLLGRGIDLFERENKIRHLADPLSSSDQWDGREVHAMLGHGLTTLTNESRDRWDEFLPQNFASTSDSDSCCNGIFSFYLMFGIHPRLPYDETPPRSSWRLLTKSNEWRRTPNHCSKLRGSWTSTVCVLMFGQSTGEAIGSGVALTKTPDYFFKVGDMVKMKHHDRLKLEFKWKGPYHVVDVGHPGLTG